MRYTIDEILQTPEGQTFDCKSILIEPKALAIIIVAMANADGGTIAVGISDKSRKLTFDERLQLMYDKGERYYEDTATYGATLNDIDMDAVKAYMKRIGYGKSVMEYLQENKGFVTYKGCAAGQCRLCATFWQASPDILSSCESAFYQIFWHRGKGGA